MHHGFVVGGLKIEINMYYTWIWVYDPLEVSVNLRHPVLPDYRMYE